MQRLYVVMCIKTGQSIKLFDIIWNYVKSYVVRWYHLYNLKNVKNAHGGVLILVKLQASLY